MTVEIVVGDVRDALATMPDKSAHVCCTSPPYFGLRSYGTPPQVWGGDATCAHEWEVKVVKGEKRGGNWAQGVNGRGEEQPGGQEAKRVVETEAIDAGFCVACGAWLGHLGLEPTLALFIEHLVDVFREVKRVLRDDGTLWLNIGDSYANDTKWGGSTGGKHVTSLHGDSGIGRQKKTTGLKAKDLMMVPARLAIALQDDGWYLRSDIIWHKRAPMPESVTDRPTSAHEHIFLLSKQPRYFYDAAAVAESVAESSIERLSQPTLADQAGSVRANGGMKSNGTMKAVGTTTTRNQRNVWTLSPESFADAHFATFPTEIPRRTIKAGTSERGCCPDCGAGWKRVTEHRPGWDGSEYGERVQVANAGAKATGGTKMSTLGSKNGKLVGQTVTLDWEPTCECGVDETVPATVLDPFSGSGTTGVVAAQLGRNYVGVELNPEYAEMSRKRIVGDAPMFNVVTVREVTGGRAV